MILHDNDILRNGDRLHYSNGVWTAISGVVGNYGDATEFPNGTLPSPDAVRFYLHEIAKLSLEKFRMFQAYQILFATNEEHIDEIEADNDIIAQLERRVKYFAAQLKPCCKREEEDDWDEDEFLSILHDARKEMVFEDPDDEELARMAGWLGTYEAADYCTED